YKDGSYKPTLGDFYDAPTKTYKLADGREAKVEYLTAAEAIKALRDNVEANGGYEKDFVLRSMYQQISFDHPVSQPPNSKPSPSSQQGQTTLEYNIYYLCNGERMMVTRCRKDSDQPGFPPTPPTNDYCQVYYPDRPKRGGFDASAVELRSDLL